MKPRGVHDAAPGHRLGQRGRAVDHLAALEQVRSKNSIGHHLDAPRKFQSILIGDRHVVLSQAYVHDSGTLWSALVLIKSRYAGRKTHPHPTNHY